MRKMKELNEQSADDLKVEYESLNAEIYTLKNELRINRKLEQPHLLIEKKKDRARVLTALNKKKS
jgi:ribosomal protein L29